MDFEKKYSEALEKARAINSGKYVDIPVEDTVLEYVFPELKESEDEKIRKALVKFHKSTIDVDGIKGEDIISWLEKQGKQKPADNVEPEFLEPAWSEEDVAYIDELTDFFEHCGELHQPQENVVKWLKSLKERLT